MKNLDDVKTIDNFLDHVLENYDTDNCAPGKFLKGTLTYSILDLMQTASPITKERVKMRCVESENITELINSIKSGMNCNYTFQPHELAKLPAKLEMLCTMISLKKKQPGEPTKKRKKLFNFGK